ncbi:MAG: carbohydrate ABC transporter permease [Chloroflexi bacterium]|nr:carbohydrate ABC transporter permease [Chloroflexota bacterium]
MSRGRDVPTRAILYILLLLFSMFFLLPMYVMLTTGFKSFDEVSLKTMWNFPSGLYTENFKAAFEQLVPHLWNSLRLVIPTAFISAFIGSINGYILTKWRFPGTAVIFPLILFGMFIPYQAILIPMVQFMNWSNLYGDIPGLALVHIIYGIPITTLIFRGYYAGVPTEMVEAARIDGANLIQTYTHIFLPISIPAFVVVLIWQFTSSWNDFLFAVALTNPGNWPIMVALNNMAGSQIIAWNVQMAASFLAAVPTLIVYIILGRYFLRGLMSGALKG